MKLFSPQVLSCKFILTSMVTKCTELCLNLCFSVHSITVSGDLSSRVGGLPEALQERKRYDTDHIKIWVSRIKKCDF